jgi:hypothetical protein
VIEDLQEKVEGVVGVNAVWQRWVVRIATGENRERADTRALVQIHEGISDLRSCQSPVQLRGLGCGAYSPVLRSTMLQELVEKACLLEGIKILQAEGAVLDVVLELLADFIH